MAESKKKTTKKTTAVVHNTKKGLPSPEESKKSPRVRNYEEQEHPETAGEKGEKKSLPKKGTSHGGKKETVHAVEENPRANRFVHQVMPYVLIFLAIFSVICFLLIDVFPGVKEEYGVGSLGRHVRNFFCGVFGFGAFFVPVILAILAFTWNRAVEKDNLASKLMYALFSILSISTLLYVIYATVTHSTDPTEGLRFGQKISALYELGMQLKGGGLLGGCLGELCRRGLGLAGSVILTVSFTFIFCVFLLGFTPGYVVTAVRYRVKIAAEKRAEEKEAQREEREFEAERAKRKREERKEERERERERRELEQEAEREAKREKREAQAEEKRARKLAKQAAAEEVEFVEDPDTPVMEVPNPVLTIKPSEEQEEKTEPVSEASEEQAETFAEPEQPVSKAAPEFEPTEEEGIYRSAKEMGLENPSEEEFSLQEIFSDKPIEIPVERPEREPEEPSSAEHDLLAEMKEISDLDEGMGGVEDDIVEIVSEAPVEEARPYEFPPIELLPPDTSNKNEDNSKELIENAQRLMDTLSSFHVRIKEITYSRGPTITRYELKPDAGVRVRSIANLVDDIALSLATTGVRIEAPIPNKPAVGIEVPNQNPATVYLRTLIDSEKFTSETSKLTACLGADVAGKPVYFNIAKMPHLLIAGATGMGKSVCINSIIVSLLYKATPDEVKLILIDPKKVEFNIYKDIPHLYCPIVSEPTKAAGALASAVAEMERRFELIEEVGVRDIYNYNAVTKDDPDHEFMPQMVIIIDELADLMMTAADAVESSICRLAQKARAAGIHIIIGTQRPSVDVITGLIKANVPSRIACTVASQVDSRTIIDIAGAEKLIGKGDMLFAPVGSPKPMRVQGAFVHESDVEKIVEFIKANNRAAKYNEEFINRIEEEAAKCTAGKKGGAEVGDGNVPADGLDPKFRAAVEVAVDSGKISTSLLQRKLEIGYGRAAKIIDQMEEMGYVSAPEGNKPRKILISKEEFMQMVVNDEIE